jgi:hypothetical protein
VNTRYAASRVIDAQVEASYREMARRWREMADRADAVDKVLADMRKPLR